MDSFTIAGVVGSLRKDSLNRKLMKNLERFAPEGITVIRGDIGSLPLYDFDKESAYPAEAQALKDIIRSANGVLIATPEYNRSIPGVLKNAIDWTSRPYGDSAWNGKAVAITGASTGRVGTALAQYHLKQILAYLNARTVGQPELYIGVAQDLYDSEGVITDEKIIESIKQFWNTFIELIKTTKK